MSKLSDFYDKWKPVGLRVWREAWLPLTGGVLWGGYACLQGSSLFQSLSAGGVAFFGVLFAQGQVLRIAKNVRDENDANEFRESFTSIREGIQALQRQRDAAVPTPRPITPVQERNVLIPGEYFFGEAEQALQHGLNYSAAVLAGIGFEGAARHCAEFMGVNPQLPLSAMLRELATLDGNPGLDEEFRTLVRIRNSLVHGKPGSVVVTKEEGKQLIEGFREGVRVFDRIIQRTL